MVPHRLPGQGVGRQQQHEKRRQRHGERRQRPQGKG